MPPKGGSKTRNGRFSSKIALRLKKVCYKVSLCENCQLQSCKAFIGLTIHAKNDWWGRPLLPEISDQTDRVGAKSPRDLSAIAELLFLNIIYKINEHINVKLIFW